MSSQKIQFTYGGTPTLQQNFAGTPENIVTPKLANKIDQASTKTMYFHIGYLFVIQDIARIKARKNMLTGTIVTLALFVARHPRHRRHHSCSPCHCLLPRHCPLCCRHRCSLPCHRPLRCRLDCLCRSRHCPLPATLVVVACSSPLSP